MALIDPAQGQLALDPRMRADRGLLILTGRADLESVAAAKVAGIGGYLVKPVSPPQLRAKIAVLVGARD